MSGKGGDLILETAKKVLADEYPEVGDKMVPSGRAALSAGYPRKGGSHSEIICSRASWRRP